MTGLRVGFVIANKQRIKQLTALQSQTIGNTSTLAQLVAKDALLNYKVIEKSLTNKLKLRRNLMASYLIEKFWMERDCSPHKSLLFFTNKTIY